MVIKGRIGTFATRLNTLEKIAQYLNVPVQHFIKDGFVIENQNVHDKANGIFVEA